ncbi:MAG: hypothetical protein ABDI20_08825 [Candidatus Bipolaricaulaceae bacterium]
MEDLRSLAERLRLQPVATKLLFVVDSYFLAQILLQLEYKGVEKMLLCAGPALGNVRFLTAPCRPSLEQSPAHVRPAPGEFVKAVREITSYGMRLTAVFHCHPGLGVPYPSRYDVAYHRILEDLGYQAVGAVVNNEGYCRFFSYRLDFQIVVLGKNFDELGDMVLKIKR